MFKDSLFNKIEKKTNINKETILSLASKLQNNNMKDEKAIKINTQYELFSSYCVFIFNSIKSLKIKSSIFLFSSVSTASDTSDIISDCTV